MHGEPALAADAEEREDLRDEIEALWADGLDAEWIDAPGGLLSGRFTAAIRHPTDAALQPARLVRRLARRAAEAGAEIIEGSRVTDTAELEAGTVIVATDGYPSGLLGELEGLIVPTRGQVIATEPLAERLFEMPHYGRHGFDYWHQTEDGRIVAGGFRDVSLEREFTADESVTNDVQGALSAFVNDLVGRSSASTTAGQASSASCSTSSRSWESCRSCPKDGWQVATRVTGTCSASRADGWSRGRSWATATRCSTSSSRRGCSASRQRNEF